MWLSTPVLTLMLCDFGAYVITQFDLTWHINTSAIRFVLQVWPALLWLAFSMLRAPEDALAEACIRNGRPIRRNQVRLSRRLGVRL